MGHGALELGLNPSPPKQLAVTGPRRGLLDGSPLQPRLAVAARRHDARRVLRAAARVGGAAPRVRAGNRRPIGRAGASRLRLAVYGTATVRSPGRDVSSFLGRLIDFDGRQTRSPSWRFPGSSSS